MWDVLQTLSQHLNDFYIVYEELKLHVRTYTVHVQCSVKNFVMYVYMCTKLKLSIKGCVALHMYTVHFVRKVVYVTTVYCMCVSNFILMQYLYCINIK